MTKTKKSLDLKTYAVPFAPNLPSTLSKHTAAPRLTRPPLIPASRAHQKKKATMKTSRTKNLTSAMFSINAHVVRQVKQPIMAK